MSIENLQKTIAPDPPEGDGQESDDLNYLTRSEVPMHGRDEDLEEDERGAHILFGTTSFAGDDI